MIDRFHELAKGVDELPNQGFYSFPAAKGDVKMGIGGMSKVHDCVIMSVKNEGLLYLEYRDGEFIPTEIREVKNALVTKKRKVTDKDIEFIERVLVHKTTQLFIRLGKGEED